MDTSYHRLELDIALVVCLFKKTDDIGLYQVGYSLLLDVGEGIIVYKRTSHSFNI